MADSFVTADANVVLLDIDAGQGSALARRLGSQVLFLEVDITDDRQGRVAGAGGGAVVNSYQYLGQGSPDRVLAVLFQSARGYAVMGPEQHQPAIPRLAGQ